jgi:hypothetical protein
MPFPYALSAVLSGGMRAQDCQTMAGGVADLTVHLVLWLAAFIVEIYNVRVEKVEGHPRFSNYLLDETHDMALTMYWFILAGFGFSALQFLVCLCSKSVQNNGTNFPTLVTAFVIGGGTASLIFTVIHCVGMFGLINNGVLTGVTDDNQKARQSILWVIALKTIAIAAFKANSEYFGAADPEETIVCNEVGKAGAIRGEKLYKDMRGMNNPA